MPKTTQRKILIVDDSPSILETLADMFRKEGYTVATAPGAAGALELLSKEAYPVMFIDLDMPETGGQELCRRIRSTMPGPRIFAITAYPSKYEFSECVRAGFDGYFTKPFNKKLLLTTARQAFKESTAKSR
ncbi:response regulator [Desulfatiglans anilini]|uniref:response regulator n=1 Tax=Desulfatiglans anilini TaxID=90728 RepID=UPI00040D548D|nr:response regulator [Desulfatiglans anilini]